MSMALWMSCISPGLWELLGSRDPTSAHPVGPQGLPQGSPASPFKLFSCHWSDPSPLQAARAELCLSSGFLQCRGFPKEPFFSCSCTEGVAPNELGWKTQNADPGTAHTGQCFAAALPRDSFTALLFVQVSEYSHFRINV